MIEIGFVFGCAIYGIIWFLTLFAVLPFGVQAQGETDIGSPASAPINPHIPRKLLITTLLAALIYVGVYALLTSHILVDVLPLADRVFIQ